MPSKRNRPRKTTFAGLFLFMTAIAGAGQFPTRQPVQPPPPPDFDLIRSYVTVTASKGLAPRLTADDFQLFEDNKEQKIDYFAVQDQPATVGILWAGGTAFDDPSPDTALLECPKNFMKNTVPGSEYFLLSGDTVVLRGMPGTELTP